MEMKENKSFGHFLFRLSKRKADDPLSDIQDMDEKEKADEMLIREHFKSLPDQKCPKHVTHEILRMTVRQEKQSLRDVFDFSIPCRQAYQVY